MTTNDEIISAEASPTCVINAVHSPVLSPRHHQHRRTPEFPNLGGDTSNAISSEDGDSGVVDCKRPIRKRVRIADEATHTTHTPASGMLCTEEEVRELWLSKAEVRRNCMAAKRDIAIVQKVDPEYLLAFSRSFQACSNKASTVSQLLLKDENVRRMIEGVSSTTTDYYDNGGGVASYSCCIRGMEGKAAHKALSQYRRLHVQNILQVQRYYEDACNNSCKKSDEAAKWELLRSASMKTSRTSRTLARLLGHMDEYQLKLLLTKELSSSSSTTATTTA